MSKLRLLKLPKDRNAFRLLMFARNYHGQKFLFLTLTFADSVREPRRNLMLLLRHLRKTYSIEYFAVRTAEGKGVYHLALISSYIHHTEIRKQWEKLTGAWNIHISLERDLFGFVQEMTGQYGVVRYSRSVGFVPHGIAPYLENLKKQVTPKNRIRAYSMFARRIKRTSNIDDSYYKTVMCVDNFYGRYSLLPTKEKCYG